MSKKRYDAVTFGDERICWACKVLKPLTSFSTVRMSADERHYICKQCSNIRAKEWYSKNRERAKASRLAWQRRLRDAAIEMLGGYKCKCCGESARTMLDIDHVNNDGAAHRKSRPGTLSALHDVMAKPELFQILCCNCNQSKHRNGGRCEHLDDDHSSEIGLCS